jgi:pSer/pThr/pTyr-binding forkhead associated (FHA) protein
MVFLKMPRVRLPQTKTVFTHRPYSPGVIDSLFELVKGQSGPSGWTLIAENSNAFLLLFILQNSPYAAARLAGNQFNSLNLRDYFQALASMDQPNLTLQLANPVLFKCLLVLTQKLPTTTGTTDLVNVESLLHQIKSSGREVVVSQKRTEELNLFYFLKGNLQEAFFADPDSVSKDSSGEDQFLEYAYTGKTASPVTLQAFYDVQVKMADDADLPWPEWPGGIVEYFLRPRPELVFLAGGGSVDKKAVTKNRFTLGRHQDCDLVITDTIASREHAVIRESQGKFVLEDLKSRNGTLVNGKRISTVPLADGDEIRIGDCRIMFVEKPQDPSKKEKADLDRLDTTVMKLDEALLQQAASVVAPPSGKKEKPAGLGLEMREGKAIGSRYSLKDKTIIGRTKADINTDDPKTSRHHAAIERREDGYYFIDLKSTNGSFINDKEVRTQRLEAGDVIRVGDSSFKVIEVDL